MQLSRVTCIASIAQLDTENISKTDARALAAQAHEAVGEI
jgi:hypothetical protein